MFFRWIQWQKYLSLWQKKGSKLPPSYLLCKRAGCYHSTGTLRYMWETGSLNWTQFMLQWFIRFPEFAESNEFLFHFGQNSVCFAFFRNFVGSYHIFLRGYKTLNQFVKWSQCRIRMSSLWKQAQLRFTMTQSHAFQVGNVPLHLKSQQVKFFTSWHFMFSFLFPVRNFTFPWPM